MPTTPPHATTVIDEPGEVLWRNDGRYLTVKGPIKGFLSGYITINGLPALFPRSWPPMLDAVAVEPPEHIETIDWREGAG